MICLIALQQQNPKMNDNKLTMETMNRNKSVNLTKLNDIDDVKYDIISNNNNNNNNDNNNGLDTSMKDLMNVLKETENDINIQRQTKMKRNANIKNDINKLMNIFNDEQFNKDPIKYTQNNLNKMHELYTMKTDNELKKDKIGFKKRFKHNKRKKKLYTKSTLISSTKVRASNMNTNNAKKIRKYIHKKAKLLGNNVHKMKMTESQKERQKKRRWRVK